MEPQPARGGDAVNIDQHIINKVGTTARFNLTAMLALREHAASMANWWEANNPEMAETIITAQFTTMLFDQCVSDAAECYFSFPYPDKQQWSI
jgi:hypothetical protein